MTYDPRECSECHRTDPRAGCTWGCSSCIAYLFGGRTCDGCHLIRVTVDEDTGLCRRYMRESIE